MSIARGGSAEVFEAEQLAFRRAVAIKVIFAPTTDSGAYARFERECLALGAVSSHPHIVVVHDRGLTTDDRPYIIMEYRAGGSLADRLLAEGKLPLEEVVDIGIKMTDALAVAHDAGVLHRDVKPAKILLSAYGEPALADFGIARIDGGHRTTAGTFSASVAHAGREVLAGEEPTELSDLYAVGSTLFELATGRAPYSRPGNDSVWQMINRVMTELPPDPAAAGIPEPLAAIVARLLLPDPTDRYESARVLCGDLVATKTRSFIQPPSGLFDQIDREAETVKAAIADQAIDAHPAVTPGGEEQLAVRGTIESIPLDPLPIVSAPASRWRRVVALAVVAVVAAIAGLGTGAWLFLNRAELPAEESEIILEEALVGPLLTGTGYRIGLSGPPPPPDVEPNTTYQLMVDGVPAADPGTTLPIWLPAEGRHQIAIEVTTDGTSLRTEPLEVYVSDGPPRSGIRVNLASVIASAEQWPLALAEFDRLVARGHTDLELSLSARGQFWNFYIDGYGTDRQKPRPTATSFDWAR